MRLEEKQQIIEDLYIRMRGKVFGLCSRYIYDYHEREEIVQEIFMNCFQYLESFESRAALETWLYKISKNRCLNHIRFRKQKKRDGVSIELQDYMGKATRPEQLNALMKKELCYKVWQIHAKLKRIGQSEIEGVMMSAVEGFSYLDIAEKLGIPQNTVRSRISRGKALLKRKLPEEYGSIV